jgi:hypothetical protein
MESRHVRAAWLSALYLALSVFFCLPLFTKPDGLGGNDWDQHLFYYGAVLKNVVEYAQPPFWNPWYCGGNVLWQNPQVALLSPVYPLTALMSLQLAMKVNIVLHYWIGFAGMHLLLTRIIGLRFLPVVVYLATLVTAAGAPAIHLAVGHSVFLPGFYLPLLVFFLMRAFRTGAIKDAALAGAILALMVFNGGVHILPMAFAATGTFALAAAVLARQWRPLVITLLFVVAGLAFSAPKLLPVSLFVTGDRFWDTRNPTDHPDRMTLDLLRHTYLDPDQGLRSKFDHQRHGWHEYGNYIGPFSALVLLVSMAWILLAPGRLARRSFSEGGWFGLSLAVTTLVLFALSLGEFGSVAPATLAAHLPLFSSFRIPSRYTIPFLLFAAMTAGWSVASATPIAIFAGRYVRAAVAIVCILASAHLIGANRRLFTNVFGQEPFDTTFHWMSGPPAIVTDWESSPYKPGAPMLRALTEDRAFFYCYESLQLVRTAAGDGGPVIPDDKSHIVSTTFTPNRIEFKVLGGAEPSRLSLNQNWSPGWTSTAGTVLEPGEAMPAVMLAPGQTGTFVFEFFPPGLVAGTAICALAVAAFGLLWRRRLGGATS